MGQTTALCFDDGNENARKANLPLYTSLYIFLPSMHDFEVKLSNFTFYGGRQTGDVQLSFLFLNLEMALRSSTTGRSSPMFDKEREVVIITLKCGTRSHFLNELFPCCRKLRHANKIYVKKKYSDTCLLLWGNERRGMKILKEFYKDVHQPQLNRGTQRWFPPKIIESTF